MDPIYNRSEVVHPILVGSLGAISTLVLARLAQLKWNHCLFLAGAVGYISRGVYRWWKFSFLPLNKWIQSRPVIDKRLRIRATTFCQIRIKDIYQSASRWVEDCLYPYYEKPLSEEEKAHLKDLALQRIAKDPKEAVVLLWLSRESPSFCASLFEESEKLPPQWVEFLEQEVFQGKIVREKVMESWKLLIALYTKRDAELEEAVKNLGPFSFEEKGIILESSFRTIKGNPLVEVNHLSNCMPSSMQDYVAAYTFCACMPGSVFLEPKTFKRFSPHLNISQLVKLSGIVTAKRSFLYLELQKRASDPSKVAFSIQAFSTQESNEFIASGFVWPFESLTGDVVFRILQFTPLSTHLQWCQVSKLCCEIGKLQSYWQVRLGADFEKSVAADLSSTTPWSDAYRKSHYLYRQIPTQFNSISRVNALRLSAFLALDKQQFSRFLDNSQSKNDDESVHLKSEAEIAWEKPKEDQKELLKFFQENFFTSWKSEERFLLSAEDALDYVSILWVDKASVPQILKWICEASVLSDQEGEDKRDQFLVVVEKVYRGLRRRFGLKWLQQQILVQLSQEQADLLNRLVNEIAQRVAQENEGNSIRYTYDDLYGV